MISYLAQKYDCGAETFSLPQRPTPPVSTGRRGTSFVFSFCRIFFPESFFQNFSDVGFWQFVSELDLGGKLMLGDLTFAIFNELFNGYGILSVAAAGNSGTREMEYPAGYAVVMSVAAVDNNSNVASFSTHNDQVDIAAPGVRILSLANSNNGAAYSSGTSMATPHVAGVVALLKSFKLNASPGEIRRAIEVTAIDLGSSGRDNYYGHGLIDVEAAMKASIALSQLTGISFHTCPGVKVEVFDRLATE